MFGHSSVAGIKIKRRNTSQCCAACGQRWIRTTEGESQQIYSLPHLSTLVFARCVCFLFASAKVGITFVTSKRNRPFLLQ